MIQISKIAYQVDEITATINYIHEIIKVIIM